MLPKREAVEGPLHRIADECCRRERAERPYVFLKPFWVPARLTSMESARVWKRVALDLVAHVVSQEGREKCTTLEHFFHGSNEFAVNGSVCLPIGLA